MRLMHVTLKPLKIKVTNLYSLISKISFFYTLLRLFIMEMVSQLTDIAFLPLNFHQPIMIHIN